MGSTGAVRFGPFAFDRATHELWKGRTKLRVPDQSLAVLALLVERPGSLVTRDVLQDHLWPRGTIVEFDHGINAAVKRLRQALSDTAAEPRYIETLPKRGYRFIVPVEEAAPSAPVSQFRILGEIGRGAMGIVYRAEDLRLGREVALKKLSPELAGDARRRERLVREARAASALNHPNIVTVHDIASEGGSEFIVMEYVPGRSLGDLIPRQGMPARNALRIASQIASGLVAAHGAGIIHRDLKPANIVVSDQGQVKLLDFGVAKFVDGDGPSGQTTLEGTVVGTVEYMSPEQAEGKAVDARSDIFSFGSLLYEMVTGRKAFDRDSTPATLAAILHDDPPPPGRLVSGLPPEFESLIVRCLSKDPAARFQSAGEVWAALDRLTGGPTIPFGTERRALGWVAGGFLAAGLAAALLLLRHTGAPEAPEPQVPFTFDSGVTMLPAISPDGKLVAYASDRAGENLDIWLQRIDGRQPVRLTRDHEDKFYPSFSPDGSRVFCYSGRKTGGIFSIDTLGGDRQRITDSGFAPMLSPDGSRIAYFTTGASNRLGKMFTVPAQGGNPVPLQPGFSLFLADAGGAAIWSPDGTHILFPGIRHADGKLDWYVTDLSANPPEPLRYEEAIPRTTYQYPCGWAGGYVYYASGSMVEGVNLYRIRIAPRTWRLSGPPERLTSGPGWQLSVSFAETGVLLYSNITMKLGVWTVPLDANRGVVTGESSRLDSDEMAKLFPSVSRDGGTAAFAAFGGVQEHRLELRLQSLRDSRERLFPVKFTIPRLYSRLNGDASLLAYSEFSSSTQATYLVEPASETRTPVLVCTGCRVLGLFNGGDLLLLYGRRLVRQAQTTATQAPLAPLPPTVTVGDGALSPDDRWLALQEIRAPDSRTSIRLEPVAAGGAAASGGLTLAEGADWVASPRWSPDGRLVYYFSDRDGYACIWAQRVDARTKAPAGPPFAVLHEHKSRYRVDRPRDHATFDVGEGRLIYWRAEVTGNIWKTKIR